MSFFSIFEFKFRDFSFGNPVIREDMEEMFEFIAKERLIDLEDLNFKEVYTNEFETKQVFLYDLDMNVDLDFDIIHSSIDFDIEMDPRSFYTIVDDFVYDDDFFLDLNIFCIFMFFFFSFYYFLLIYSIFILLIDDLDEYNGEQLYDNLDFLYDDYDITHYFHSDFFFEDISYEDFSFFSYNLNNYKSFFFFSKFKFFCKSN